MKIAQTIVALVFSFNLFSQSIGGLMVRTYTNTTNELSDNKLLDSTTVRIVHAEYAIDTTICFSATNNFKVLLKTGTYKLTCKAGDHTIEFQNVLISGDRLTFVDLLFEPKKPLNYFARRARKKEFYNY